MGSHSLLQGIFLIRDRIQISCISRQAGSLPTELPGKPKGPADTQIPSYTAAKSLQSSLTLCDPMDCSLSGSSVHGIFQARILEWVVIAFSEKMPKSSNIIVWAVKWRKKKKTHIFILLVAQMVKKSACTMGDLGSIPGSGRSPGEGNGYPL